MCCTPRYPILSTQTLNSHPSRPDSIYTNFFFHPSKPGSIYSNFFSHPSRPDFICTNFSRNCCTPDSYYTMLFYATPLHRYSLLAMLLATPNASRYSQCCYSLLAMLLPTRYSQSYSQRYSLAKAVATCNNTRNSQHDSVLSTLFAMLRIIRDPTRYCLLASRNATRYSIRTISQRYAQLATRDPQRSPQLATLLEYSPNPW